MKTCRFVIEEGKFLITDERDDRALGAYSDVHYDNMAELKRSEMDTLFDKAFKNAEGLMHNFSA